MKHHHDLGRRVYENPSQALLPGLLTLLQSLQGGAGRKQLPLSMCPLGCTGLSSPRPLIPVISAEGGPSSLLSPRERASPEPCSAPRTRPNLSCVDNLSTPEHHHPTGHPSTLSCSSPCSPRRPCFLAAQTAPRPPFLFTCADGRGTFSKLALASSPTWLLSSGNEEP